MPSPDNERPTRPDAGSPPVRDLRVAVALSLVLILSVALAGLLVVPTPRWSNWPSLSGATDHQATTTLAALGAEPAPRRGGTAPAGGAGALLGNPGGGPVAVLT